MLQIWKPIVYSIVASLALFTSAMAQNLEVKRYNPSEWTKGRFSEIVTVNGPGKTIYLAGIGAEEEKMPRPVPARRSAIMATPTSSANTPTTRSSGRSRPMAVRWPTP